MSRLVVFSRMGPEQAVRSRTYSFFLTLLIPADCILLLFIYFRGPLGDGTLRNDPQDLISLLCTFSLFLFAVLGFKLKSTRILTFFINALYVDALLTLSQVYSLLQMSHFLIQVAICQTADQFKTTLVSSWFSPPS
eukprot:TRINITY_DN3137_c0_g1_i9.p1 TRINITY_DN3137_c0_g1~~TRINITY_DN3137_c0_g1_i9.p1  ORF type:complete len:159 (+),score=29.50 TRINITY_DN3137_c0_g1_i9:71-478(+)